MQKSIVFFLLILGPTLGVSLENPVKIIEKNNIALQKLLKNPEDAKSEERRGKIKNLINGIFDFEELGRKALGTNNYQEFTEDQKVRFTKAFKTMVENSSMNQLEVYKSDSTRYEEPTYRSENKKAKVIAHTFYKGRESILEYQLWQVDGQWKAWDLVIDDLSTYRQYKERFSRVLKKKSIEDLITMLEIKADGSGLDKEEGSGQANTDSPDSGEEGK